MDDRPSGGRPQALLNTFRSVLSGFPDETARIVRLNAWFGAPYALVTLLVIAKAWLQHAPNRLHDSLSLGVSGALAAYLAFTGFAAGADAERLSRIFRRHALVASLFVLRFAVSTLLTVLSPEPLMPRFRWSVGLLTLSAIYAAQLVRFAWFDDRATSFCVRNLPRIAGVGAAGIEIAAIVLSLQR